MKLLSNRYHKLIFIRLQGWLEPLLDRIARDPTTVVCPVIDVIDDTTLEYHWHDSSGVNVGGFDWNLQFNWHAVPDRERKRHTSTAEPVATPTMAGGLFSIWILRNSPFWFVENEPRTWAMRLAV